MIQYIAIFTLFFFPLIFFSAYGEVVEITTDKSVYYEGDAMLVSGIVSTELPVTSISVVVCDDGLDDDGLDDDGLDDDDSKNSIIVSLLVFSEVT